MAGGNPQVQALDLRCEVPGWASLQQEAFNKLGFAPDRTMKVAQKLYEGVDIKGEMKGLITYMRTDSYNVSEQIQKQAREFIKKNYGDDYCPEKPPVYAKKVKGAQEAHEAIHPTDVNLAPDAIKSYVSPDEHKLYELIWKKFISSQMESAVFDQLSVEITDETSKSVFKTGGRTLKFDGYLKIYSDAQDDKKEEDDDEEAILPPMSEGDEVEAIDFDVKSHSTTPPPNYNEASLIKTLENHGIGRPSTYATIITTVINRGYIKKDKSRKMLITDLGRRVTEKLIEFFPDIMSLSYTADIEDKLDDVADGKVDWVELLDKFYSSFRVQLDKASANMKNEKIIQHTNVKCPICASDMILRESRYGKYLTCSKFPKCRGKTNLGSDSAERFKAIKTTERCDKCKDGYMVLRKGPKNYFMGCSNFPRCRNTRQVSEKELEKILPKEEDKKDNR